MKIRISRLPDGFIAKLRAEQAHPEPEAGRSPELAAGLEHARQVTQPTAIRQHQGFGHGLAPGTSADINCHACQAEDRSRQQLARSAPVLAIVPARPGDTATLAQIFGHVTAHGWDAAEAATVTSILRRPGTTVTLLDSTDG